MPVLQRVACLVACGWFFVLVPGPGAGENRVQGRPVVELLQELRAQGLNLVFSTAVVPTDLLVRNEPSAATPRDMLRQILAPLGLVARDGPGSTILILPGNPAEDGASGAAAGSADRPGGLVRDESFTTEIVVTPGKHSLVQQEQVARLTVSDEDTMLVPAIGGDVSRIIELLPGVAAADNSGKFSVRGGRPRDVSMVLDGLELYEPFHLESFQSPFSFIDNHIVDRIDFYSGGYTVDHGDRHGGVVDMSTRMPVDAGSGKIEVGTLNSRGSYGAVFSNEPGSKGGSWLASMRAWYPGTFLDTMEVGDSNIRPRFEDLYSKASVHPVDGTVLSVHGLFAADRFEYQEIGGGEIVKTRNSSGYVWLRALRSWSRKHLSETVLSVGRIKRYRDGISEPEDDQVLVTDERIVDFSGLKHNATWRVSDTAMFKAGVEYRRLDARYNYSAGLEGEGVPLRLEPHGTSLAMYASHRGRLGARVVSEFGMRWDRQTYTHDSQFSPRLNLRWQAGQRTEVRLGAGRFAQSQRIHELSVEDGETTFSQAELSRQVDLSWRHRFLSGISVRVDGYFRSLSRVQPRYENLFNPIELFPETESDRVLVSPDKARLYGAELLLRSSPGRPFTWWVSYARATTEDVIDGADVPRSWDQTHAFKFLAGYRLENRWWLSVSGTAHTGWPTTPVGGEEIVLPGGGTELQRVLGPRNSIRYPDYWRLDAKVSRLIAVRKGRMRLDLEVTNLTDRKNVCCTDDVELELLPDGSVDATLELRHWLGIRPSVSLLWEF